VQEGTIITTTGKWHITPFSFDELKAPQREVPLASVKVANRDAAQQEPRNEPFGQSGVRCQLFDPLTEEPYGVVDDGGSTVTQFNCKVNM